ncbi:hypothetical protein FGIG_10601 [Fasciola gigantica]|uniref:Uncharacterized protein n=1 Tax=Fasciola gigantica TaxID=46835 RepID=A0A504Z0A5_FASGI|nr:hypothetical protein FGIG_10601 [Fasciola gigantica]
MLWAIRVLLMPIESANFDRTNHMLGYLFTTTVFKGEWDQFGHQVCHCSSWGTHGQALSVHRSTIMFSVNWLLLSLVLMWFVPCPFCTPVQEIESNQSPASKESKSSEKVSNENVEAEKGDVNLSAHEEDSVSHADELSDQAAPANGTSSHEEAKTEEVELSQVPETSNGIAPIEEDTLLSEQHSATEVDHTEEAEETPAPLAKSAKEISEADVAVTTEHAQTGTAEYRSDAKTIVRLLDQLLSKLDAPPLEWNDYQYITALKNSDGSIYLPKHHRQSTRKHLTTLLGFAEEIVVSKNALAHLDWTDLKTTVAPPKSDITDEKATADQHNSTTHKATEESNEELATQNTDRLESGNFTDEHETPSPNFGIEQLVSEQSTDARYTTVGEQSVLSSNTEPLASVEAVQSTEFVTGEGKSEVNKEGNPSTEYEAELEEKKI